MADGENDDAISNKICKIYDQDDFFTILVQIVLASLSLVALWIKRMREKPKRKFKTWSLDVSKQCVGACYAHVMNMIIAALISQNIRGESELEDQCAWYGLSFLIDTTLGLAISIFFLGLLRSIANERDWTSLKNSGVYVGDDAMLHWIHQVIAWLAILTVVKIILYFFMWGFSEPLAWIGGLLFAPLQANIRLELVFVMMLFPGFLNVIYFWISDSYLQAQEVQVGVHEEEETVEDKKESLLTEEEKVEGDLNSKPWTNV